MVSALGAMASIRRERRPSDAKARNLDAIRELCRSRAAGSEQDARALLSSCCAAARAEASGRRRARSGGAFWSRLGFQVDSLSECWVIGLDFISFHFSFFSFSFLFYANCGKKDMYLLL
jgi:hypothetical protein